LQAIYDVEVQANQRTPVAADALGFGGPPLTIAQDAAGGRGHDDALVVRASTALRSDVLAVTRLPLLSIELKTPRRS
jgi:hypothetical protein